MTGTKFLGKTAWVTGADSTVGMAVAKALHREGAKLLLSGVEAAPQGMNENVITYPDNPVTTEKAKAALALTGAPDIVVLATRTPDRSSVLDGDAALFDRVIEENLIAGWCALHAAAGKLGRNRSADFLVLASIHGEKPTGSAPLFSMANGGLNMLVKDAAQELGRFGSRVNMLRYGPIEGDEKLFVSDLSGIYHNPEERVPRGKIATTEEIVGAALLLLGEGASFINGAILTADGGFLGHYTNADMDRRWEIGFGGGEHE